MKTVLTPYNLGTFQLVEEVKAVSVNQLVANAKKVLKKSLVEAQMLALGIPIQLTTTKTRFHGERIWFVCPQCRKRVGVLFKKIEQNIGCRKCLGLVYRKQRYKGMVEASL